MSRNQNSVQVIEPVDKLNAYLETLDQVMGKIIASGVSPLPVDGEELNLAITQALQFIKENEILSIPSEFGVGSRINHRIYNDIMDSAFIDITVTFARLRALILTINTNTNLITSGIYSRLSSIDEMLDELENLSNLRNTDEQFDSIEHNTFIEDDNTVSDLDFKADHHEAGGIITLSDTFSDRIVTNERNFDLIVLPLNYNTILKRHSLDLSASQMVDAMDISLYSYKPLYLNGYEVGRDPDGIGVPIVYNGGTVAIIMRLASLKFINNLSMKFISAGLMDVVDVYYSEESATDILNYTWNKIYYSVDPNNIRGATINFPTIQANSVMLILGQKHLSSITSKSPAQLAYLSSEQEFNLSKFLDKMQENINVVNVRGKINEYVHPDVAKSLDENTRKIISSTINEIEQMIPPETPTDLSDTAAAPVDYAEILEYNFSAYEMRVNYIHFRTSSSYDSDARGGDGKISDIVLTTTQNIPSGTIINHYIRLSNGLHRILPNDEKTASDIITVIDKTDYEYATELLINVTQPVTVILNNITVINPLLVDLNLPYPSSSIAVGITIDSSIAINFGDSIEIRYTTPEVDQAGNRYNPNNVNIEGAFGNPILKNQSLILGKTDRFLVKNQNGTLRSYDIPTEGSIKLIPASGETEEPALGFEILSGSIKDIPSVFPPSFLTNVGEALSGDVVAYGTKRIFYGILDEPIPVSGATDEFNTQHEYTPGSLHVTYLGKIIPIEEYETDLAFVAPNDKTYFTTQNTTGNLSGTLLVSYIPADGLVSGQVTNIASKNYSQLFQSTEPDATVGLDFYPHIDTAIVRSSVDNPAALWNFSYGKFINKYNETIIYDPITIRIGGYEIPNRTDYIGNVEPTLSVFTGRNYEYYVRGKKIHFNTVVNRPIEISYYVLNDTLKYAARLYRVNRLVDDITPEIYGYALFFNENS